MEQLGYPLNPEEQKTIQDNFPESFLFGSSPPSLQDSGNILEKQKILENASSYVLKSFHGFGGQEIVIGCEEDRPVSAFESKWNKGYIAQEYIPQVKKKGSARKRGQV